jgi:hypothetical protein
VVWLTNARNDPSTMLTLPSRHVTASDYGHLCGHLPVALTIANTREEDHLLASAS